MNGLKTVAAGSDGLPPAQRRWVMGCALLGIVLTGLDAAIANIALPTIAHALVATDAATIWVVNSYNLAVTVLLLPAAALGESMGLKRIYGFGLTLFTVASLGCALSSSLDMLVAARALQGIGGACMAALGGALVRGIYPRKMLGQGFALIALAVAISAALGPTIAALILAVAPWPWLFLVNVPLGLIAVPLFLVKTPASPRRPRPLDPIGAVLSAAALGLIVTGVDGLGGTGINVAIGELAAGLLCGALLVWQQFRRPAPMLPLDLLRIPLFALSVCTSICSYAAQILAYLSLPFLFETVMHRTTVATGLLVTPWPLLVAFAAPVAGRLSARYPAAILGSIGMTLLAIGLFLLATMPAHPADWNIAWRMGICGIGFGFYQTPNNLTLMTAGPPERTGAASGMQAVARTVGWSMGSAMVALIFGVQGGSGAITCLWVGMVFAAVGAIISVSRTRV
ncbi:MFS transporter [Acidisphaera sp. L21]|uniref:MFS transporter n=1 Tax=Acidisphaera sp. L21 TaxID=1641851 RepID=UPI00131B5131|nr:MFS transporter [Acidisphaera sp. L21]